LQQVRRNEVRGLYLNQLWIMYQNNTLSCGNDHKFLFLLNSFHSLSPPKLVDQFEQQMLEDKTVIRMIQLNF